MPPTDLHTVRQQRMYLWVVLAGIATQVIGGWYSAEQGLKISAVASAVGVTLDIISIPFILKSNFRVFHLLALANILAWLILDIWLSYGRQHAFVTDVILEGIIFYLLTFTFLPVQYALMVSTGVYILTLLALSHNHLSLAVQIMIGVIIVLCSLLAQFGRAVNTIHEHNKRLNDLAYRDSLTGLFNRHVASQEIENMLDQIPPERLALALFDIDHFKNINDTLGHLAGDAALVHMARLLSSSLQSGDILLRWGGEEFLMVWQSDPQQAQQRTQQLIELIRNSPLEGYPQMTISGGGVMFSEVQQFYAALSMADQRLYRAKNLGRNQMYWGEDI